MKVIVLGNYAKRKVKEIVADLGPWVKKVCKARKTACEVERYGIDENPDLSGCSADLVIVVGGDGSMLAAARLLNGCEAPVIGVNVGKLGYLAGIRVEHAKDGIEKIITGEYEPVRRMMLSCGIRHRGGKKAEAMVALNDAVLSRGASLRMLDLVVRVDGEFVCEYRADGLIISTPTGSTAYSLAAGGPIISPLVEALIISPICAHTLTNRPLVISSTERVEITVSSETDDAALTLDGQTSCILARGDVVTVGRSEKAFVLAELTARGKYGTLREKLHWGRNPAGGEGENDT